MIAKIFVFVLFIVCFPYSNSEEKFNYYKLVFQWPISICIVRRSYLQPSLEFIVHGLWPFLAPNTTQKKKKKNLFITTKKIIAITSELLQLQ